MNRAHFVNRRCVPLAALLFLVGSPCAKAQISPSEIQNPQLRALEQKYFSQLIALNKDISKTKFPYPFQVDRYIGLNPEQQARSDQRGLEFVEFHGRNILKFSGNYNAAFSAHLLSRNQRANQVLDDVITPVLGLLPGYFHDQADFDGFGFEISYHVLDKTGTVNFEGRENLVVLFSFRDALVYAQTADRAGRQNVLSSSEVYVSGQRFGLALDRTDPSVLSEPDASQMPPPASPPAKVTQTSLQAVSGPPLTSIGMGRTLDLRPTSPAHVSAATSEPLPSPSPSTSPVDLDDLQAKFQSDLDALAKDGVAKFHFVDYAPPSLVLFRDAVYLQITIRNPVLFDRDKTSIYKRAAQSFDLFFAPQLQDLLAKFPSIPNLAGLSVTVLHQFGAKTSSSEAVEYVFPLASLKEFIQYAITNQALIDQGVILVNGVRISLNLQQVE
jgi:hypothetical protein